MNGGPPVPCATYGKIVHIFVKFPPQCGTTSGPNAATLPEVGKGGETRPYKGVQSTHAQIAF